jgi:hypothetical protein
MFNKNFYERIRLWKDFRNSLETSADPFTEVLEFWRFAPLSSMQADPFDSDTWPNPWEMIEENIYCEFVKILAICYTLQLTDRFSQSHFEIHIAVDKEEQQMVYLLFVDNQAIGYYNNGSIESSELINLDAQIQHVMHPF